MPEDARPPKNDRPWFQVDTGILDSLSLAELHADHERLWWRLIAVNCRRGHGDTLYGRVRDIAFWTRSTDGMVEAAIEALVTLGMLVPVEGGWKIVNWYEYQPASTSTERMRRKRDKDVTSPRRQRDVLESESEEKEKESQSQTRAGRGDRTGRGAQSEKALAKVWDNRHASTAKVADVLADDPALALAVRKCGGWGTLVELLGDAQGPSLGGQTAFLRAFGQACHTLANDRREAKRSA